MENQNKEILSPQLLNQIGKQLGYSNSIPPQFAELASTLLMSGLSKNVNSEEGVESLYNALQNDHAAGSEGVLDNLEHEIENISTTKNGEGILDNVLGEKLQPLVEAFSKATGMPQERARKLLTLMAPVVLAILAQKLTKNTMGKKDVAKEVKDTYRRPRRNEYAKIAQEKFQLEQREKQLEEELDRLKDRKKELKKLEDDFENQERKKEYSKYEVPSKDDEKGLLEQLLDKNNDGNFMDEATQVLRNLLLR